MKKTQLKRKTPLKNKKRRISQRSASGKKVKPLKSLKKELWELCRQIQFTKYGNICYTCGKPAEGMNRHLGHFIPSSVGGASLRYSLDNLRPQCYFCNIHAGGNGAIFYKNLVEREGQEHVNNLFKEKQKVIKADQWWFISKIAEYRIYLQDLLKKNESHL